MKRLALAILTTGSVCGLMLAPGIALAQTTYDFSGATETGTASYVVQNPSPGEPSSGTGGPGSGESLTLVGSVTLAAPLGDNLSNYAVTPTYAELGLLGQTAGGPEIGSSTTYAGGGNPVLDASLELTTLTFSTNSRGQITDWDLALSASPESFESFTATSTPTADFDQYLNIEPNFGGVYNYDTGSGPGGSSWTVAPVPVPATVWLLLSGLGAIGLTRKFTLPRDVADLLTR